MYQDVDLSVLFSFFNTSYSEQTILCYLPWMLSNLYKNPLICSSPNSSTQWFLKRVGGSQAFIITVKLCSQLVLESLRCLAVRLDWGHALEKAETCVFFCFFYSAYLDLEIEQLLHFILFLISIETLQSKPVPFICTIWLVCVRILVLFFPYNFSAFSCGVLTAHL